MTKDKKKYVALVPIWVEPHRKTYQVGDVMEISDKRADSLMKMDAVKLVVESSPQPKVEKGEK